MALGPRGDVSIAGPGPVDHTLTLDLQSAARLITQRDRDGSGPARWVWWSAEVAEGLLRHGCRPARVLDLAQGHLLLAGGSDTSPERVWAAAMGLSVHDIPARARGDLFDLTDPALGDPRQVDGTPGETGLDPAGYLLSILAQRRVRGHEHLGPARAPGGRRTTAPAGATAPRQVHRIQ